MKPSSSSASLAAASAAVPSSQALEVRLRSHAQTFSTQDLIVNPEVFACKIGDIMRIASLDDTKGILLQVTDTSKVKGNVQVSICNFIGELFSLPETGRCQIVQDPSSHHVDFVALSVKGTYVGRGEMHKLVTSLNGRPLYLKQTVSLAGLRVQVTSIWHGQPRMAGIVGPNTKVVFRSKSARLLMFFQVSREMMEFDEEGNLYFEKAIKFFLVDLFKRWNVADYDHALSVVFFSRSFFKKGTLNQVLPPGATLHRSGDYYVDHYREVVHMENRADWLTVIPEIKIGFSAMRAYLASSIAGENSRASEGNFLEAINLALNIFDKHYVDRDLRRSGQQIIIVTAGNGQFDVDPVLTKLTKRRMMEGIGCDVMCLKPRPLHAVPLFRLFHTDGTISNNVPSWFYVSYVERRRDGQQQLLSCQIRDMDDGDWAASANGSPLAIVPCNEPSQLLKPNNMLSELGCNPFSNLKITRSKATASKRRWVNVYHGVSAATTAALSVSPEVSANPNYRGLLDGINWDSITEPALLPLSTDYFPPAGALKAKFTEHPYTMSLIPMENHYDDNPRLLLKELIYQRLVHGYQIVQHKSRLFSAEEAGDRHGMVASVYYLSMAQDFQVISYDPLVSQHNVEVKIFHKIEDKAAMPMEIGYTYRFWRDGGLVDNGSFRTVKLVFRNDKMNYRLWNVLDRFIAGPVPIDGFPLLKYWRVGFILIANAGASQRREGGDLEWRRKAIENFNSFKDFLESAKIQKGQPKREMDVNVAGYAVALTGAPGEVTGGPGRLDPTEMSPLAKRMAVNPDLIQDLRKGLRTYRDSMLGADCVDFVMDNVIVTNTDEAVNLITVMVQYEMLIVVRGTIDDVPSSILKLVRLEPAKTGSSASGNTQSQFQLPSFGNGSAISTSHDQPSSSPIGASPLAALRSPTRNDTETTLRATIGALPRSNSSRVPINRFGSSDLSLSSNASGNRQTMQTSASDSILEELTAAGSVIGPLSESISEHEQIPYVLSDHISDPLLSIRQHPTNAEVSGGPTAKSLNRMVYSIESTMDRHEWLHLAHDKTYYPNRTFYLVVEWMACTGSAVNDFVQLVSRKAKSCSLDMIQIPLNFYQRSDPFFLPVEVPFDVPSLTDEECEAFQSALLKFSNFLLMQASSFEWVHATGSAFVSVSEHRWFQWYFNSLLIERDKGVAVAAKKQLEEFRTTVNKFRRAFSGDKSVFSFEDSADIFTVLSFCHPAHRPKLEALAVSAGLVSLEMLQELVSGR